MRVDTSPTATTRRLPAEDAHPTPQPAAVSPPAGVPPAATTTPPKPFIGPVAPGKSLFLSDLLKPPPASPTVVPLAVKTPLPAVAKPAPTGLTDTHLKTVSEQRVPLLHKHLDHGRQALAGLGPKGVGTNAWKAAVTEYEGARTALEEDRAAITKQIGDARTLGAGAEPRVEFVMDGAQTWGNAQVARIDAALASGTKTLPGATRDPDLIRPGEQVATKVSVPALRVVTDEEVRWDVRTKADNRGLGDSEADHVAHDPKSINDPLRLSARTDPIGYAAQRLALDHNDDLEYQQVLQRVLPGVRGDYTVDHVNQLIARDDLPGAIGLTKTNLDHTGNRAERRDLWARVQGNFTEAGFAAAIDRHPPIERISNLSPNLTAESVGGWVDHVSAQGLPPEIATPLAAAVKSRVLDRWDDEQGSVGPKLYSGLSTLAEAADVPYSDAAPITPGLAKFLVQRIDQPSPMTVQQTEAFELSTPVAAGNAKLSVALARALDDPDHADLRAGVVYDLKQGVDQLRKDTTDAFDAWSKDRAAIDFVGRNFSDPAKPDQALDQVRAYRERNPERGDSIDQQFLDLGVQGQRAAQVVQDAAAGGVFGDRDKLSGVDADLDEALDFGRGSRGPIQFDYKNGEQQKVMYAIQSSPQLRQNVDNELLFSPTGASAQSADRWAGEAHGFIAAMAASTDHQTNAPLLTADQARALGASVDRWRTAMRAEAARPQPDDAAIAKINASFESDVKGAVGNHWIASQLRSDLPIKRHGLEDYHLGAIQVRMVKNAVDLFGEAYLKSSINGSLREFGAQRVQSGGSLVDAVKQSPLLSRYAGNPGWMPFLGVDRGIGATAGQIAVANAELARDEINALAPGPDRAAKAQQIIDDYRQRTQAGIDQALDLHGQQTPFSDPSKGVFGASMRGISASTNGLNAYNQFLIRGAEDRADPALIAYGTFSALTAARDTVAIGGMLAGRNLAVDSSLFKVASKAIGAGWVIPEAMYLQQDVLPNGNPVETTLQVATTLGQVAESASLLGLEADVAFGLTTGGVGTLVVAASQFALAGYYQLQSVRDSNVYEPGGAGSVANFFGLGFSDAQMQDKTGIQASLKDLGFTPDQTRELLNQTGHGVSPMIAINQWGESRGLSFQQRLDYLRRLTPTELRDALVPRTHDLIDGHLNNETLKIPATDNARRDAQGRIVERRMYGHGATGVAPAASQVASLADLDGQLDQAGIGYDAVIKRPWTSPLPPTPNAPAAAAKPQPVIDLHTVERGDTLWDLYGGRDGLDNEAYPDMPWFDPAKENGDPYSG